MAFSAAALHRFEATLRLEIAYALNLDASRITSMNVAKVCAPLRAYSLVGKSRASQSFLCVHTNRSPSRRLVWISPS